jgi:excisionase family DNA binding protein
MKTHNTQRETENTIEKRLLTLKEACQYIGISRSYMHKLTAARKIPFSKPYGKIIYFDKAELEEWLLNKNRVKTNEEINDEADRYRK